MRNIRLDESQAGIKIADRNISNLRYADDTTLMAESEEELGSLLMMKEESEKAGLKLNIRGELDDEGLDDHRGLLKGATRTLCGGFSTRGGRHEGFRAEAGRSLTCGFTGPLWRRVENGLQRPGQKQEEQGRSRVLSPLRIMLGLCSAAFLAPRCPWREPELSLSFKAHATPAGLLPPALLSPPQSH